MKKLASILGIYIISFLTVFCSAKQFSGGEKKSMASDQNTEFDGRYILIGYKDFLPVFSYVDWRKSNEIFQLNNGQLISLQDYEEGYKPRFADNNCVIYTKGQKVAIKYFDGESKLFNLEQEPSFISYNHEEGEIIYDDFKVVRRFEIGSRKEFELIEGYGSLCVDGVIYFVRDGTESPLVNLYVYNSGETKLHLENIYLEGLHILPGGNGFVYNKIIDFESRKFIYYLDNKEGLMFPAELSNRFTFYGFNPKGLYFYKTDRIERSFFPLN